MRSTFGSVDQLPSGKYRGRFRDPSGKHRTTGTHNTEKEAWMALAAVQTDLNRRQWVDERKGDITLEEHANAIAALRKNELGVGTQKNNTGYLRNQLLPYFKNKRLRDITIRDVDTWWATVPTGAVNRRNAYFYLSSLMRYALRYGYIQASPCQVVAAGKDVAERRPAFTEENFRAVVDRMPADLQVVAWVMYGAHLRIGEACGLDYRHYNPMTGQVE